MPPKKNLIGQRFGRLVVIAEHPSRNGRVFWECKCDCGNIHVVARGNLQHGHVTSCGCKHAENSRNNIKPNNYSQYRQLWIIYRMNARKRNIPFLLETEDMIDIVNQDCYYCGSKPKSILHRTIKKIKNKLIYNGLDRIDNSQGYIKDNIVPCCEVCNRMKLKMAQDEFLDHVEKIAQQRRRLTMRAPDKGYAQQNIVLSTGSNSAGDGIGKSTPCG